MIRDKTIKVLMDSVACMFYRNLQGGHSHILCAQKRCNYGIGESATTLTSMELVHPPQHRRISLLPIRMPKYHFRFTEQEILSGSRVGSEHQGPTEHIQTLGIPKDLFAATQNAKCSYFCSRAALGPCSLSSALLLKWDAPLQYAFPPTSSSITVIHKIKTDNSRVILIVPTNVDFLYLLKITVCPPCTLLLLPHLVSQNESQVY